MVIKLGKIRKGRYYGQESIDRCCAGTVALAVTAGIVAIVVHVLDHKASSNSTVTVEYE